MKKQKHTAASHRWVFRIILFVTFFFLLSLFPAPHDYFMPIETSVGVPLGREISFPSPPLYPVKKTLEAFPTLSAEGIFIQDLDSGAVIFAKNERKQFPPASTTKIIGALVALETYQLDDVITIKTVITEGRVMGLVSGERLTVESLLYGSLVHSANDAAYALAEHFPGGVDVFVTAMNKKAEALFLTDTRFTNPVGFDDPLHYTTASDLSKQAIAALHNKTFQKIVSTRAITVSDVDYTLFHPLQNVNALLGKVAGVGGVKTGYTQNAGEVLVSEVKKDGRNVLFVVLRSLDRFGETTALIDFVFANIHWVPIESLIPTIPDSPQADTQ